MAHFLARAVGVCRFDFIRPTRPEKKMTDSEWETMMVSEQSKRERSNGFEGCKRCGDGGFYLQTYSAEGYCRSCELACFPERFYPCVHCRVPLPLQMSRLACAGGCKLWIEETHCDMNNEHSAKNDRESLCKRQQWHRMAEDMPKAGDHDGRYEYSRGWPGFYMGRDAAGRRIWKKLPYLPKITEGAICIEEPWYLPPHKSLAELLAHEWTPKDSRCVSCNNGSSLKMCKQCGAHYCGVLCAERTNHGCAAENIV